MTINLDYTEKVCVTCGCIYYVPSEVVRMRKENKESYFCFNGHSQSVIKSTSERVKEEYEEKLFSKNSYIEILQKDLKKAYNEMRELKPNPPIKRRANRIKTT